MKYRLVQRFPRGMVWSVLTVAVLGLAAMACVQDVAFTPQQVQVADAAIDLELTAMGYTPLKPDEARVICGNYERADWDTDLLAKDNVRGRQSARAKAASEIVLPLVLRSVVENSEHSGRAFEAGIDRAMIAGYCAHK